MKQDNDSNCSGPQTLKYNPMLEQRYNVLHGFIACPLVSLRCWSSDPRQISKNRTYVEGTSRLTLESTNRLSQLERKGQEQDKATEPVVHSCASERVRCVRVTMKNFWVGLALPMVAPGALAPVGSRVRVEWSNNISNYRVQKWKEV